MLFFASSAGQLHFKGQSVIFQQERLQQSRVFLDKKRFFAVRGSSQHAALMGGRGSMATQRTDKELAPDKAAGKVLVPLGRECHWETSRPGFRSLQRSILQRCGS